MFDIAALAGGAIGGISSLLGGNKAAKAAKQAAQLQDRQYRQTRADLSPYRDAGTNALAQYGAAVGLAGPEEQAAFYQNFQTDPGFETSLDNALAAAMRKYAILGNTGGGLATSLLKTGQNALYGQYKDRISQLGGLVDTGRAAAGSTASAGATAAANQGNLLSQAGMLQGQGIMGLGQGTYNALADWTKFGQQQAGMNAGGWNTMTVNRW